MRAKKEPTHDFTVEHLANLNEELRDLLARRVLFWKVFAVLAVVVVSCGFWYTMEKVHETNPETERYVDELKDRAALQAQRIKYHLESNQRIQRERDLLYNACNEFTRARVAWFAKNGKDIKKDKTVVELIRKVNEVATESQDLAPFAFLPVPE